MSHESTHQLDLPGVPLPPPPRIIGLIGLKQSGKDTVCQFIGELAPVTRLAFADGIKEEVADALGVPVEFVESNKQKLRGLLQHWGTECRRDLFDRDYWVKQLAAKLPHVRTPTVVVTDVRFANEAHVLAGMGARLIRVQRGNSGPDGHASEAWADSVDAARYAPEVLVNDSDLDTLRLRVAQAFSVADLT